MTLTSTTTTTIPPLGPPRPVDRAVTVTQYSRRQILAVWAAAAVPMATLSWVVAPAFADGTEVSLFESLVIWLTAGLAWQLVLVLGLVGYEQRTLRWSRLKEALWLRSPTSPEKGRVGGRTWLVLIPLIALFGLHDLLPSLPAVDGRDFGAFLESDAGAAFFDGAWGWYALVLGMFVLNTVLGEELLFRGVLLPRMQGAFGDRDWVANGVLFGLYHLHVPWSIPVNLLDTFFLAYPSKRYRSAWIGIGVHSAQSVVLALLLLTLVV